MRPAAIFRWYKLKQPAPAHPRIRVMTQENGEPMTVTAGSPHFQCYTADGIPFGLSPRRFNELYEPE